MLCHLESQYSCYVTIITHTYATPLDIIYILTILAYVATALPFCSRSGCNYHLDSCSNYLR